MPLRGPSSVPFWHITSIVNQQLLPGQALLAPDQFCDSLAHSSLSYAIGTASSNAFSFLTDSWSTPSCLMPSLASTRPDPMCN